MNSFSEIYAEIKGRALERRFGIKAKAHRVPQKQPSSVWKVRHVEKRDLSKSNKAEDFQLEEINRPSKRPKKSPN